jgi:hypothetical protein
MNELILRFFTVLPAMRLRDVVRIAAPIIAGALLGLHGLSVTAGEFAASGARTAKSDVDELERAFWQCDHALANRVVSPQVGMLCVAVTDELRQQKFDGSSERMLVWWRTHRVAEHQRLSEAGSQAGSW